MFLHSFLNHFPNLYLVNDGRTVGMKELVKKREAVKVMGRKSS
jgi:hypothetical protein